MYTSPLVMSVFILMFSHSAFGQSNINTLDQNENTVVNARVNFVIKIPMKLSINIHNGLLTSRSNTGNIYINDSQDTKDTFISEDNVITQQKNRPGSYIVASP